MSVRELASGSVIGERYRLGTQLGRGGMGVVFAAVDEQSGEKAALKFLDGSLLAEPEAEARFRREIDTAKKVTHRNVVQVIDSGVTDAGVPWFSMELLDGLSLGDLLVDRQLLSVPAACAAGLQLLDALESAHAVNVVHRDVKPANVFLEPAARMVRLLDFGVARLVHGGTLITRTGAAVGTPQYMAPEQVQGHKQLTPAADLYSLGVVLYRMVSGKTPFEGINTLAVMHQVVNVEAPPLKNVPVELADLVAQLLEKEPGDRPSAKQVRAGLKAFASERELWNEVEADAHRTGLRRAVLATPAAPLEPNSLSPLTADTDRPVVATARRSKTLWFALGGAAVLAAASALVAMHLADENEADRRLRDAQCEQQVRDVELAAALDEPRTATRLQPCAESRAGVDLAARVRQVDDRLVLVGPPSSAACTLAVTRARALVKEERLVAASKMLEPCRWSSVAATLVRDLDEKMRPAIDREPSAPTYVPSAPNVDDPCLMVRRDTLMLIQGQQLPEAAARVLRCRQTKPDDDATRRELEMLDRAISSMAQARGAQPGSAISRARPPLPGTPEPGPTRPAPAASSEDLLAQMVSAYKSGDYVGAKVLGQKCVAKDPAHYECHKQLGATYAKLNDGKTGAKHYELFVKYAPVDHPSRGKVMAFLDQYKRGVQ